jgi:hypothetical protein
VVAVAAAALILVAAVAALILLVAAAAALILVVAARISAAAVALVLAAERPTLTEAEVAAHVLELHISAVLASAAVAARDRISAGRGVPDNRRPTSAGGRTSTHNVPLPLGEIRIASVRAGMRAGRPIAPRRQLEQIEVPQLTEIETRVPAVIALRLPTETVMLALAKGVEDRTRGRWQGLTPCATPWVRLA